VTDAPEKIAAFERELEERLCTRTERCRFGIAYFHEAFPRRWVSNFVWADAPMVGVSAPELAADADDVLGRAGLAHRVIWVQDLAEAERLAPGMAGLGYRIDRNLVMVHAREPDRWTDERAEEIDLASARRFHELVSLESEEIDEAADARMLAGFLDVLSDRIGARFFGARVDGEVVSGCALYHRGEVAQVEDVATLGAHRGRGLARATVLLAVRAAREAGADLVFLGADAEDWPRHLYRKLGFDVVGRSIDFVRRPERQRA
jgi:ribosomal protein S18 acetylase RimI-like enzyme